MRAHFHFIRSHRLVLFSTMLFVLSAQPQLARSQQAPDTLGAREAKRDWMQAELTLDNSGYAATRAQVDRLIRQGQKPATLEFYSRLQGRDIYDAQKIFRWAYSSYRVQKLNPTQNVLSGVEEAMNRNLRPGAYDWVRLRFLIASLQMFLRPKMQLIDVGRRLLQEKHNDEEVTFHLVRNLNDSELLSDRKEAVVLARAGAYKHPQDLYWQWQLADALRAVDDFSWKPSYQGSQAAVAQYKKILRVLPTEHPARLSIIKYIVQREMMFDANGNPQTFSYKAYQKALKNTNMR